MYEFVGRLMAGAIQSDEHIVVPLPPYGPRRLGAVRRPWRFPTVIHFGRGLWMGAQGV
jgi:hypothetical protein